MWEGKIEHVLKILIETGIKYGLKLIVAVLIFIIGFTIARRLSKSFSQMLERRNVDLSLRSFLGSLINIFLKILTIIIVLTSVGFEMTSIVAILGAGSLAIGMALSGTLQNFAGGVVILLLKPFRVGDTIETQGLLGNVHSVYIFTTRIRTPDNKTIFIPNGTLANGSIINYTKEGTRRLDLTIGISYGNDVSVARKILMELIEQDERILKTPEPVVVLSTLGGSSVDIMARLWMDADDLFNVQCDLNEKVYEVFPQHGLNFPFPQLQIHNNNLNHIK